ncbi:mucin-17-like [Puntigrus tetrazona]|uniref:mucin-17-like n=1 Tax=Puntigrus tetrazona TaxID=1606681 RepID=UPI001C8AB6C1|nr:mucin-17-like [Puntigrus tetrazona]
MLPLLVVFLFWRDVDGFTGGASSSAHHQPSDTFSPRAVQSSMSEEVGSSLFIKPLESTEFNPLQFVKGGFSSSQSTSYAQTSPSSSVSASLLLPVNEWPLTSLTSSDPQYAASGSGPIISTQGEYSNYPAKLDIYGQLTSDGLLVSSPQETDQSSPSSFVSLASGSSLETSSQLLPLVVSSQYRNGQNSPSFSYDLKSTDAALPSLALKPQGPLSWYSPVSPTKYVSVPMSAPQAMYSQSTDSGSSYRVVSQVGSPSQMGVSGQLMPQGGNFYSRLLPQSQATSSQNVLGNSKPFSSPQSTLSQYTSDLSSRKQYTSVSQGSSGTKFGASTGTGFASQGMGGSYSGLVQPQGTKRFAPASQSYLTGVSLSSPQAVTGPSVQESLKRLTSTFMGTSGTQAGSSTLQGSAASAGSPQLQDTARWIAPGSSYPYASLSLSSPQTGPSTSVQGFRKQLTFTGTSGTQAGSSTLQGSAASDGSPQLQDTARWIAPGSSYPYASLSLSSPQTGPSTSVQGFRKQLTSTFTGTSGTQAGSSTLQGSAASDGSPQLQDTASQLTPGSSYPYASLSLSSPQTGPSTSVQGFRKQLTSTFTGTSGTQAGSSTLQGSTASDSSPQLQDTASQLTPGSSYPYASLSLSSPQTGPSTSVQGFRKQLTSTFTGTSGTQAGSSTLQGSAASDGSPQLQDTASQLTPGSSYPYASLSLSSPQTGPSTSVQGFRKQLTSTFTGTSGTQAGSSTLQERLHLLAHLSFKILLAHPWLSLQPQTDTASQLDPLALVHLLVSGSSYPWAASLSLSSPQTGPSTSVQGFRKQLTSTFTGTSGTQAGSSTLQGAASDGSPQLQDTASQLTPGSSYPYASLSLSSPQTGPSTSVQGFRKQLTSTFTASRYCKSTPGSSYPYASLSLSSPQTGPSTSVQGFRKQLTSTFTGTSGTQAGSSTLQGSAASDGSPQLQDTASQLTPGSSYPYASLSLSSPQTGPSTSVQGFRKQLTSTFTGTSGTQAGSSTLQGGTASAGSPQLQDTASQLTPGSSYPYASLSLSSPQTGPSTSVQGFRKQLTSTFTGTSGTQAGSSTLQGGTASAGSPQLQDTASQLTPGSSYPYASLSLSSPQTGPSTSVQGFRKQLTSTFTGTSGTQAGSSTLQGSAASDGSPQLQDTASQLTLALHTPICKLIPVLTTNWSIY